MNRIALVALVLAACGGEVLQRGYYAGGFYLDGVAVSCGGGVDATGRWLVEEWPDHALSVEYELCGRYVHGLDLRGRIEGLKLHFAVGRVTLDATESRDTAVIDGPAEQLGPGVTLHLLQQGGGGRAHAVPK